MPAQIVLTAEEWLERMNHAAPPTADDVGILWDGRRLDSREAVMAWLAEVAAQRSEPMATADEPAHDLRRLIEALDHYAVEYLIVGGAAAVAYGAARPTEDAD